MMNIFLDDERLPPKSSKFTWIVVRNTLRAKELIVSNAELSRISFDHDLGENEPTGFDLAKWLVEYDLDNNILNSDFLFTVHSMNPIGSKNIRELLNSYLRYKFAGDFNYE